MRALVAREQERWICEHAREVFMCGSQDAFNRLLLEDDLLSFDAALLPVGWWDGRRVPATWRHGVQRPAILGLSVFDRDTGDFIADARYSLMGAYDDCLPASCHPAEVLARIEAIRRRTQGLPETTTVATADGRVSINLDYSFITVDGRDVTRLFTPFETKFLTFLALRRGNLVSRESIMRIIYSDRAYAGLPQEKIIDVFACKVRKKLGRLGIEQPERLIALVWGRGYIFDPPSEFSVWKPSDKRYRAQQDVTIPATATL